MIYYTATYDPADDKLRLSAMSRLDPETYATVKAAGFGWAPKQGVFYAVWSPRREDLLIEMAGEIGDEDTTLVDRAEQRAERFEGYQERRAEDAERAHAAVERIADGIPLGQPILVGHHSERHARKDAAKIENGMRKAIQMWDTSQYWKSRAAGAIMAAKYKERPDVRARRIKTIEAELRQSIASYTPHANVPTIMQARWSDDTPEPVKVPHVWVGPKGRGGHWVPAESIERIKASSVRCEQHLNNRLAYERAMLAEGGGIAADKFDFAVGGRVSGGGEWYVVKGLNRKDGALLSLSVVGRYCSTMQIEEVKDYRVPESGDAEKVKAALKLPPLVNYRAPRCIEMTSAEWKQKTKYSDSYFAGHFDAEGNHTWGRVKDGEKPIAYRQRSKVSIGSGYNRIPVFLTDAKVVEPPKEAQERPKIGGMLAELPRKERPVYVAPEPTKFDALKQTLKGGVKVVSAPQLFPTPPALAERMAKIASIGPVDDILEPSAGTGRILDACFHLNGDGRTVAVEMFIPLANAIRERYPLVETVNGDFLEQNGNLGKFDKILMNPPFVNAADIKHIKHAIGFLKPGGVLVAICANGPRQQEALKPLALYWEDLPEGTFSDAGTNVRTAMFVVRGK